MRNVLSAWVLILVGGHAFGQRPADKLSPAEYEKLTTSGPIVLIDFYAPWCGPCKLMEPVLEELAEEKKGIVQVVRINIDDNRNLIRTMNISEIPAVKIYKNGKEEWSGVGVIEKRAIKKQLNKL